MAELLTWLPRFVYKEEPPRAPKLATTPSITRPPKAFPNAKHATAPKLLVRLIATDFLPVTCGGIRAARRHPQLASRRYQAQEPLRVRLKSKRGRRL